MATLVDDLQSGCGYPRPQLRRHDWRSLNGEWKFAIDALSAFTGPGEVDWAHRILVPFSPETLRSGIGDTGFFRAVWYSRQLERPSIPPGHHWLLHSGAVDSHDLTKPRGKQDWQLNPHSFWYPPPTGIWQTVCTEVVPPCFIKHVRWTPNLERWELGFEASVAAAGRDRLRMRIHVYIGDLLIADDTFTVIAGEVHRRIALWDTGIDDYRNELPWSPETPTIIDAELELRAERGEQLDAAASYTALRSVGVQRDRFVLNGRPYQMRLILDQGYWTMAA